MWFALPASLSALGIGGAPSSGQEYISSVIYMYSYKSAGDTMNPFIIQECTVLL